MTILSAKDFFFFNLKFKGSESTEKDKITENTVAERPKITKKYGITLVLEKYCNTIRNRWQVGRWFVRKQYKTTKQNNKTNFIENWKITNYITFPPANSL